VSHAITPYCESFHHFTYLFGGVGAIHGTIIDKILAGSVAFQPAASFITPLGLDARLLCASERGHG
jgi:hypothetical protein